MARLVLTPIGSPRDQIVDDGEYSNNAEKLAKREERFVAARAEVEAGWGERAVRKVHAKGKLTTWQRIRALVDAGSDVFPVGTFVNHGETFGERGLTSPGAGVVTAFGRIEQRWCLGHTAAARCRCVHTKLVCGIDHLSV